MSRDSTAGHTILTVLGIIGIIVSCILIFFGVLFMWAAFGTGGETGWLAVGAVTAGIGLVITALSIGIIIYVRFRRSAVSAQQSQQIVQKIDFTGDIAMEKLKCKECGAELEKDSVSVKEGAVFISCPYCGLAYQVVEEPKW